MNTISIRELQRLTVKELKEIVPCVITSNGLAMFLLEGSDSQGVSDSQEIPIKDKELTVKAKSVTVKAKLCKHGQMFCKFGCK